MHPASASGRVEREAPGARKGRESGMKKAALIGIIAVLAAIGVLFFYGQNSGKRVKIIREGDQAPEFRLSALDGKEISLSSHRGKVVMVHFWATWCPPCVEELPTLERLYSAYYGKDLEILAVSVDEGGAGAVAQFMERNRFALPVLLNPDQSVARQYGTFKFPETYLLDRDGIVRKKVIGAADWMSPTAQEIIQAMVRNK